MSRLFNVLFTQTRSYRGQRPPAKWKKDFQQYDLVKYYPRHPDHVDPPVTPTKLFMVQRVKSYKGNPWWHKAVLDKLKLNDKLEDIAIVKNTPENCAELWKIKHLIDVTPINLPERLPTQGTCSTYLHPNGDLLIAPKIDAVREKATTDFLTDRKRMDRPYLMDYLRRRWMQGHNP